MVKISVIGLGLLGSKIAGYLSYYNHDVMVYDRSELSVDKFYRTLAEDKYSLLTQGLIESIEFKGKIEQATDVKSAVENAQLVIECAIEKYDAKVSLFNEIESYCSRDALIVTNTLNFDINQLAEHFKHKERFLGLRFLLPVYFIPEVEAKLPNGLSVVSIEKLRGIIDSIGCKMVLHRDNEIFKLSEVEIARRYADRMQALHGSFAPNAFEAQAEVKLTPSADTAKAPLDCDVCMLRPKNCVFQPCNHLCACYDCAVVLQNRHDPCPICRNRIINAIKVFIS